MATNLDELSLLLNQGAQASGNLAGLDERYERANALRDQPVQEMRGNATGTGLSAIANLMNNYTGNKRAAAIEPQRAAAREQMAGAKNALPMYQAQQNEDRYQEGLLVDQAAIDLAAENRAENLGIDDNVRAQGQANLLQQAIAQKEKEALDRQSRLEIANAKEVARVNAAKLARDQKAADKATAVSEKRIAGIQEGDRSNTMSMGHVDSIIAALERGAGTGPIESNLPEILKSADSQIVENSKQKLGLTELQQNTFGSLSEKEGAWVRESNVPNLDEDDMLPYMKHRKEVMERVREANQYEIESLQNGTPIDVDYINSILEEDGLDLSEFGWRKD